MLPKWAEEYFSYQCSIDGVVSAKPNEDIKGWDFLLEFPDAEHLGPAEAKPPQQVAYVQVKSTTKGVRRVSFKLSNMLNACSSKDPWFLILFSADSRGNVHSVYALHVWSHLIRRTLSAVRKASLADELLHKKTISIAFPDDTRVSGNLADWMREKISSIGGDYSGERRKITESVGYEDGWGLGHMIIEARSEEEILDTFLGLGEGVPTKMFRLTRARFGMLDAKPEIDSAGGRLKVEPEVAGNCELQVFGPPGHKPINLQGVVYSLNLPGMDETRQRLRFSAPPIEIVCAPDGNTRMQMLLEANKRFDLVHYVNLIRILKWSRSGGLDLQLWVGDECLIDDRLPVKGPEESKVFSLFSMIINALNEVAGAEHARNINLSVNDIDIAANDLLFFGQALCDRSLRVEFAEPPEVDQPFTSALCYLGVVVNEVCFSCLVKRQVTEDVIVDGVRRVTMDKPIYLATYCSFDAKEVNTARVSAGYSKELGRLKMMENPLGLEDMIVFRKHLDEGVN